MVDPRRLTIKIDTRAAEREHERLGRRLAEIDAAELCVFCEIIACRAPAVFVRPPAHHHAVVADVPLDPVTPGHVLFVPKRHVAHAGIDPYTTAQVAQFAAGWAAHRGEDFNLITSGGRAASQTVRHLHLHYVPRRPGDGLALPWAGRAPAGGDRG